MIDTDAPDIAPGRIRLTEPEIADVRPALADPSTPAWARELLDIVANPGLRIVLRIFTAAPLVHRIWATPQAAVAGAPARPGVVELAALEPALIPFILAHAVGLRRGPAPPDRAPIRLPVATYRATQQHGPVPPQLAALVQQRRTSWRAMSAWRTATGPVTHNLHITDAGPAGLWRLRVETPDLLIEPTNARDVWRGLTELLPGSQNARRRLPG